MSQQAEIVICGAGIAGVSAAFFLARQGAKDVLLVDERSPLTLTSQNSTECYRNAWPQPALRALIDRAIDWLEMLAEESGDRFHLNRRGYLYVTTTEAGGAALLRRVEQLKAAGLHPVRVHDSPSAPYRPAAASGFKDEPEGADLLLSPELILSSYPYLNPEVKAALHIRRAGWMSAQQLGMYLLEAARARGVRFLQARVIAVDKNEGMVNGIRLDNGERVIAPIVVNAAGPMLTEVNALAGVSVPVFTELHQKVAFHDPLRVVPRDAPLLILDEPQLLAWNEAERQALQEEGADWLLGQLPGGAHLRPEGGPDSDVVLMLWEYRTQRMSPRWPLPLDKMGAEITLRGLTRLIPGLQVYLHHLPRPQIDGGYYTRTPDHLPLIGPTDVKGFFLFGALGGYGIMAACGAAELLAAHVTGLPLPEYAPAFLPERFTHGEWQVDQVDEESGQL